MAATISIFDRMAALSRGRWMLLLIGTALIIRCAWCIALSPRQPRFDERHYIAHAINLAEGKGYIDEEGRPAAYWPVGYPTVLATTYAIFGQSPWTGILLQVVLGTATCVLVSLVGVAAFGPSIGRLSALFLAVYPTQVFYSTLYLTEPLFALLFVASVALLLKSTERGTAPIAGGGFAIGLAALVRPVILLLPLALPVWYWRIGLRRNTTLVRTLLVLSCMLIAVSPWLVRNHGVTGRWIISTEGGQNFWMGNYPGAFGGYAYRQEINERLWDGSGYDFSRGYLLGLAAITASPLRAGIRVLQKMSYFFALETDGVLWNLKGLAQPPPMGVTLMLLGAANAAYLFVLSFAVLGLMSTPSKNPLASLFLVVTGYLVLVAAAFVGDPRYHYSLVPLAVIFAAKGLIEDWPVLSKSVKAKDPNARRKLLVWGAIVLVFLVLMVANIGLKALEFKTLGG